MLLINQDQDPRSATNYDRDKALSTGIDQLHRTALQVVIVNCLFSIEDNCEIVIMIKKYKFQYKRYILSYAQIYPNSLYALYESRK